MELKDVERKLRGFQRKLDDAKAEKNQLIGERKALEKTLAEYGITDLATVEDQIKKLERERDKYIKGLDAIITGLQDRYGAVA